MDKRDDKTPKLSKVDHIIEKYKDLKCVSAEGEKIIFQICYKKKGTSFGTI